MYFTLSCVGIGVNLSINTEYTGSEWTICGWRYKTLFRSLSVALVNGLLFTQPRNVFSLGGQTPTTTGCGRRERIYGPIHSLPPLYPPVFLLAPGARAARMYLYIHWWRPTAVFCRQMSSLPLGKTTVKNPLSSLIPHPDLQTSANNWHWISQHQCSAHLNNVFMIKPKNSLLCSLLALKF